MDKRRECYSWRTTGLCRFGNSCRYAHDGDKAYKPPDSQHRQWSNAQASTSYDDTPRHPIKFSLMSYNVLADELASAHAKELYKAVPDWCLRWSVRIEKVMSEIVRWRPDVICLQEVDHPDDFTSFLGSQGYNWKFAARTGDRPDGCLTLWHKDKFDLVTSEIIQMSEFGLKDNVGLIVLLRARESLELAIASTHLQDSPVVAIANTHLLFNPKRGDIKLGQAGLILRRIDTICQSASVPPLAIFTGDFNSTPESAIYSFVRDGELDCYLEDRRNLSGQLESRDSAWPPTGLGNRAQLGFPAAYEYRRRGTSLDDPSRTYRTELMVRADVSTRQPSDNGDSVPPSQATSSIHVITRQPSGSIAPSNELLSLSRGGAGMPLTSGRASGPILAAPGQQPLYPYSDQFGQVAWSYMPPSNADITRQPFFHEPMLVEEPRPPAPPSPPPGISRTLSFAQRQINAGTWTTEQLMIATNCRPAGAPVNPNANGRSQYPRPSPTEVWVAEHPIPMQSSYRAVLGAEPAFTSCHSKFIGTVDYVWFTPLAGSWALQPTAVLLPPPLESLHCGLPSPEWPSDHISLLAKFTVSQVPEQLSDVTIGDAVRERSSSSSGHHILFTD